MVVAVAIDVVFSQKKLGPNIFCSKKSMSRKLLAKKILGQKKLGPKSFGPKNYG